MSSAPLNPDRSQSDRPAAAVDLHPSYFYDTCIVCVAIPNLNASPPRAASVKSSPRSRSRLERLKARGRWKPQSPTDPHGEDTCTNLWPHFTVPRPRHSLPPRLQRVAPPRLGQAMRRLCFTRSPRGKISHAWVSPRTRRVAWPSAHGAMGHDLPQKGHNTLTFAQLSNCCRVGGRRSKVIAT